MFFLERKNQRTFENLPRGCGGIVRMPSATARDQNPEVFWFFFSKKNVLP
jgi:hypothetical protein